MSSLVNSYIKLTSPIAASESFEELITARGLKFVAETNVGALSAGSNLDIVFKTKDLQVLLLGFDIEFNQEKISFTLIEGVGSVTGTTSFDVDPFNTNRPLNAIGLQTDVEKGDAVYSGGTIIYGPSPGFGTAGQGSKGSAGSLSKSEDFIWLNLNTNYVLRITNESSSAIDLAVIIKIAESQTFPIQ